MAITLSSQGIVSGAFGSFTAGMGHGATNYYSAAVIMKLDESGPFDMTTLMPFSGGTVGITGAVAVTIASMPSTPVTGTFWQTTQPISGTVTANLGTIAGVATAANQTVVQASGQNAASPASEIIVGGQFNTSPTTITTGNVSPFQLDANGNLLVNVKAGGGSGGTSSSFAATFPGTGTAVGGEYLSSPPTLTTGQMVALQTDINGNVKTNLQTALPAGANAIGSIIGRTTMVTVTPTVTSNGAYSAGNEIGGLMTFAIGGAGSGELKSVRVTSKTGALTTALQAYIFTTNPTNSTWTNLAAPAISTADIAGLLCCVNLSDPASGLGTMTIWNTGNIGAQFVGANLYVVLVAVAAATLASTSTADITVELGVRDD